MSYPKFVDCRKNGQDLNENRELRRGGLKGIHVVLILLLLVPWILTAFTPLYDVATPTALGLPFFYWFQIVMLPVSAMFYLVFSYLQRNSREGPS
jgi:hypothetical protein